MRHKNVCVGLASISSLVGALTFAWPATAQDLQSSIAGVWKVTKLVSLPISYPRARWCIPSENARAATRYSPEAGT
jgi:hypothetical protein